MIKKLIKLLIKSNKKKQIINNLKFRLKKFLKLNFLYYIL